MLKEKLLAMVNEMDISDLLYLHQNYCDAVNAFDNCIYSMDDLEILCSGHDAFWIACRIFYGDFNPNDDYIKFNGYGNFVTFNEYGAREHIYISDIIDYIIKYNNSLYNDDIQDLLDQYEEESEE